MERLVKIWPPVVSALLLLLGFPPFNLGLLVLVALVPWLIQLRTTNGKESWKSGYLLGLVYGLGQLWWLFAFVNRWTQSPGLALIPYIAAVLAFAVYFGLAGWLINGCWRRQLPILIPFVWAGIEVFRSYLPVFAFPWGIVATPLWLINPISQMAFFGSIFLVSAWCLLVSTALAMMLEGEGPRRTRLLFNGIVVGFVLSLLRMSMTGPTEPMVVTIGQPGVDMAYGDKETEPLRLRRSIQQIIDQAVVHGSRFVALPEGIADARRIPPDVPFETPPPVPVLFGAQRGVNPAYQSAFVVDKAYQWIDKTRLVIFGEFVPGRGIIPYPESFRLPSGDLAAGTRGVQSLEIAGYRVGPVLCFEALFPDIAYRQARNGAQALCVMSIDDWYMGSPAPDQLRAGSIWRSIETGLPLVRSASTGYTLATNDRGQVLTQAPLKEPTALRVELNVPTRPGFFSLFPMFPILSLLAAVYAMVFTLQLRGKKADPATNVELISKS